MLDSSETRELPHRKCLDSLSLSTGAMYSFKLHAYIARKKKESDNVAQASYQVLSNACSSKTFCYHFCCSTYCTSTEISLGITIFSRTDP
jgi:hypothetical protein